MAKVYELRMKDEKEQSLGVALFSKKEVALKAYQRYLTNGAPMSRDIHHAYLFTLALDAKKHEYTAIGMAKIFPHQVACL
jgi:hypothetical protein